MRESELQGAVVTFLSYALPPGAVLHHSPNEGKRGWQAQRALKSHGVRKGWPDIEIVHGGRAYFIELKASGKHPSPEQRATHAALKEAGCPVFVARSVMEVALALETWGVPLRARCAA